MIKIVQHNLIQVMAQYLDKVEIYVFTTIQIKTIHMQILTVHIKMKNMTLKIHIHGKDLVEIQILISLKSNNGKYGVYSFIDDLIITILMIKYIEF